MRTSRAQIVATALEEAIVLVAYSDGEHLSIGIGHNDQKLKEGDTISLPEVFTLFAADLVPREKDLCRWLKVEVTQYEFDALSDVYFNKGAQVRPVIGLINAGRKPDAVAQMLTINRNSEGIFRPGLAERRMRNMRTFLYADYGDLTKQVKIYRGNPKVVKPEFMDMPELAA